MEGREGFRWVIDRSPATSRNAAAARRDVDATLHRGRLLAERQAIVAALPADPTAAIRTTERELDGLRRRRSDLEVGRGSYANHPVNRAVLDHEQAQENVARLQVNLSRRRLPWRERREKETELAQWRPRLAASAKALDDIRTPERERLDKAEKTAVDRLGGLHEQREQRAVWFAGHPEAPRRLGDIDRAVDALNVAVEVPTAGADRARVPMRDRPWLRDIPAAGRSLDVGLGL